MKHLVYASIISVALGIIVTTAQAQDTPKALQDAFVAAVLANDPAAIADLYTSDAVTFPPMGFSVTGRDGIQEDWEPLFNDFTITGFSVEESGTEIRDDLATSWGVWNLMMTPKSGGDAVSMRGRYLDVSKRVDGKWYYAVDHASVPIPPELDEPGAP